MCGLYRLDQSCVLIVNLSGANITLWCRTCQSLGLLSKWLCVRFVTNERDPSPICHVLTSISFLFPAYLYNYEIITLSYIVSHPDCFDLRWRTFSLFWTKIFSSNPSPQLCGSNPTPTICSSIFGIWVYDCIICMTISTINLLCIFIYLHILTKKIGAQP